MLPCRTPATVQLCLGPRVATSVKFGAARHRDGHLSKTDVFCTFFNHKLPSPSAPIQPIFPP